MEKFLKSRYRSGEKLGESPFSFTYKGYLIGTEVPIVIKIYKRSALNSPLINKLRPKVTKIISLDHPNIARVIDGDYGWQGFYFIREFIEGEDLEEFLERGVPDIPFSIELMKNVLSALAMAHKEKLLHGALSPKNIYVSGGKEVKVADFILEPMVRVNPSLLAEAATIDSSYMPPEQIKGEELSFASDIYSAGIVFYKVLTGAMPFGGSGGLDTALLQLSHKAVPPSHFNPKVPAYVDALIMKMLEKDPVVRMNSAADALESLERGTLVYKLPSREFMDVIYDEDLDPIVFDDIKPKKIHLDPKKRRISRKLKLIFSLMLIAIAAGLWYAFILDFISSR
jgi:eukaryotic-like serine/threonine-protein kinase